MDTKHAMITASSEDDRPPCIPRDTSLEAARAQFEALRRMSPAERLAVGCRMIQETRALIQAGVRHRHPDYDEEQVRLAVIRVHLGNELFQVCFPGCDVQP